MPKDLLNYTIELKTKELLGEAYLPFIKNGALIINNKDDLKMGDQCQIALSIMNETSKIEFTGEIVWVDAASSNKVGAQITGENASVIRKKIENYLAGSDILQNKK